MNDKRVNKIRELIRKEFGDFEKYKCFVLFAVPSDEHDVLLSMGGNVTTMMSGVCTIIEKIAERSANDPVEIAQSICEGVTAFHEHNQGREVPEPVSVPLS